MSEFGLQSWPSAITMAQVLPQNQWNYDSEMSVRRNHHPDGQSQMLQQISMHFHLAKTCDPASSNNCQLKQQYAGWAQQLWLTQLNQALGYKAEIEHFRRIRTDCSQSVPGCNMVCISSVVTPLHVCRCTELCRGSFGLLPPIGSYVLADE